MSIRRPALKLVGKLLRLAQGADLLLHTSSNASHINAGPHGGMIVICKDKNAK